MRILQTRRTNGSRELLSELESDEAINRIAKHLECARRDVVESLERGEEVATISAIYRKANEDAAV